MKASTLAAAMLLCVAGLATAQEPPRWTTLDEGVRAGRRSGRPVLVVTTWKPGVCITCDAWRDRVPIDADVQRQLPRFERVEWTYDGLAGTVIAWTRRHGGTSDDPTLQAFVVEPDTGTVARAGREVVHTPDAFAKWLKAAADAYEKTHPVPKLAYVAGIVKAEGDGAARKWTCPAVHAARKDDQAVLLFVSRSETKDADRDARAQAAASKKLEKDFLESEKFARLYRGWALVKIDVADPGALAYAKSLGVERAPAYLHFIPGEDAPQPVDPGNWGDVPGGKGKKGGGKK